MNEVLILGHLCGAVERFDGEPVRRAERRLIGASPGVCEFLRDARLPHASISEYVEVSGWEAIHAQVERALRGLSTPGAGGAPWLDDWSHLIVDEARELFLWSGVARRILAVERPASSPTGWREEASAPSASTSSAIPPSMLWGKRAGPPGVRTIFSTLCRTWRGSERSSTIWSRSSVIWRRPS
jgi:hypothetical protein